MTAKRAAAYLGVASLLVAWLASAAGVIMRSTGDAPAPRAVATSGAETLASDVQAQASRLRDRMASAPSPHQPLRNPFAFAERKAAYRGGSSPSAPAPDPAPAPVIGEPPLSLVGVAEQQSPTGVVRTAVLTSDSDEVYMLKEGDVLGARYRVKTIGADAVELSDLVTGSVRRLALR